MAWPVEDAAVIAALDASLFHFFNASSALMNGSVPVKSGLPPYSAVQSVQVMSAEEIERRIAPAVRLPRQIEHYNRLVDHYLNVKDSAELRVSMEAHFERLVRYHRLFLEQIGPPPRGSDDASEL